MFPLGLLCFIGGQRSYVPRAVDLWHSSVTYRNVLTSIFLHSRFIQTNRNSDLPRYISSAIRGQAIFSPLAGTPNTTVRPISFIPRPVPQISPARAFCRTLVVGRNSLRFTSHEIAMIWFRCVRKAIFFKVLAYRTSLLMGRGRRCWILGFLQGDGWRIWICVFGRVASGFSKALVPSSSWLSNAKQQRRRRIECSTVQLCNETWHYDFSKRR